MAESLRENINNKERLHKYIGSIISDLNGDLKMYDQSLDLNRVHQQMIDSIVKVLHEGGGDVSRTYQMARNLTMGSSIVFPNTKTFEQMKSSGDMRLIKRQFIADSIGNYYQWTKKFDYWSDLQKQRITDVIEMGASVFDANIFFGIIKEPGINHVPGNASLITHNTSTINNAIMKYQYYYGMLDLMNQRCKLAMTQDKELLDLLQKEYPQETE